MWNQTDRNFNLAGETTTSKNATDVHLPGDALCIFPSANTILF